MADRILVISPYPPPYHGTSIPSKLFVEFLRERCGAEVTVINTHPSGKPWIHSHALRAIAFSVLTSVRVIKTISLYHTVFISGSNRFIVTLGAFHTLLFSLLGKRVVVYIHGGAFDNYYRSLNPLFRFAIRLFLNRAKNLVVQTKWLYQSLFEEFRNIVMLPLWTNAIASAKPKIALTASDDGAVRFVYVGEVRREKGIQELIHAFRRARHTLQSHHISITLDIFGPTKSDFRDTFYDLLNSSEHIMYHGYVDHAVLIEQLGHFDALVLPTYLPTEGYPGVLLEAMAAGLAIITTRCGAIPEIVSHEENGLLCDPGDVNGLAEHLVRIALDDQLRRHLGEKAREMARQFDVNVVLPRLCALCGLKILIPAQ